MAPFQCRRAVGSPSRASGPKSKYLGDDYAFAQTSPVYITRGGRRYLKLEDVQFLLETVNAIWTRVEKSLWRSDSERDAFSAAIERGRAFYQKLAAEAAATRASSKPPEGPPRQRN